LLHLALAMHCIYPALYLPVFAHKEVSMRRNPLGLDFLGPGAEPDVS
jgi:hypothetical protein